MGRSRCALAQQRKEAEALPVLHLSPPQPH